MTFKLYNYVLSGNCYKIRLMASLLDVKFETVSVDFYPGYEHRSEHMRALNPSGTLPVLQAKELVLTETQAMLIWLAAEFDRSGLWFPKEDPSTLAQVMEWLGFSARLTRSIGLARLHSMIDWPTDIEAARRGSLEDLRAFELHLNDRVMEGGLWVVGDHPTVADIACFPYIALSPDAGFEHDPYPAIRNWLYAVRGLPRFTAMPGIHYLHDLNEMADG